MSNLERLILLQADALDLSSDHAIRAAAVEYSEIEASFYKHPAQYSLAELQSSWQHCMQQYNEMNHNEPQWEI